MLTIIFTSLEPIVENNITMMDLDLNGLKNDSNDKFCNQDVKGKNLKLKLNLAKDHSSPACSSDLVASIAEIIASNIQSSGNHTHKGSQSSF